jgi:ADP-heptose:LPS heptosyltransferase
MRFLVVSQAAKANIYGQAFELSPLDPSFFEPKNILVADNVSASELLNRHSSVLREALFDIQAVAGFPRELKIVEHIPPESKVLILRSGGVGDHVMFLPALCAMKKAVGPNVHITLATQKEKHPIFNGQDAIEGLLPLPLGLDHVLGFDFVSDLSGSLCDDAFNALPMTDYFLTIMGLDPDKGWDKSPRMHWNGMFSEKIEKALAAKKRLHPHRPMVVLEWKSSVPLRDFPAERLIGLAGSFPDVHFLTAKALGERALSYLQENKMSVTDVSPLIESLEDYISLFWLCDGVVSTDTAAYHLAEAFGKPSLALFGPIFSGVRTRYYRKSFTIDAAYEGRTCRAPCGLHKTVGGCEESRLLGTVYSPCYLSMDDEILHRGVRDLLGVVRNRGENKEKP